MLTEKTQNVFTLNDDDGERLILHYDLLVDKILSEDKIGIETYGISIYKYSETGVYSEEEAEFHDISTDEKKVSDLLECLIKNAVTPISLPYIIEDFLSC